MKVLTWKCKYSNWIGLFILGAILLYFFINIIRVYSFSLIYNETKSDVAIVLGAGTINGKISPVFRERINHGIYLYEKKKVDRIIFTGGYGEGQKFSDSHIARNYALKKNIPDTIMLNEQNSKFTSENIIEAKIIMDTLKLQTALLVSDPLHMKRAMKIANDYHLICKSSPTLTTMYISNYVKFKYLLSETFYFSMRELATIFD